MELSHYRMLKLEGILEMLWLSSLLRLQEEESCPRSLSWLMAGLRAALKLSPAPFLSPGRRGMCLEGGIALLSSCPSPPTQSCSQTRFPQALSVSGSESVSTLSVTTKGEKKQKNLGRSMDLKGQWQRWLQTQWSLVPAPT